MTTIFNSLHICETATKHDGPVVVMVPNVAAVTQLAAELRFFAPSDLDILIFPDWETLPYDKFSPHQDIISERLATLYKLLSLTKGILLVAVTTIMQRLAPRTYIEQNSLMLNKHEKVDLTALRNDLSKKDYYCVDQVMQHGEYAIRGSIIDIFPMGSSLPYRIDLFDNEIDSIRTFDPETQRSLQELEYINLLPAREFPASSSQRHALFDYLANSALLIHTTNLMPAATTFWDEINERYEQLRYDITRPLLPPADIFIPVANLFGQFKRFSQIKITEKKDKELEVKLAELPVFLQHKTERILFCAESMGRREALLKLLTKLNIVPKAYTSWHEFLADNTKYGITIAQLEHGLWQQGIIVIPESLLLDEQIRQRRVRQQQQVDPAAIINNLIELQVGDPVVHVDHGIGRFQGLQTLEAGGQIAEYLMLEYADAAKLYVPIAALQLISRYMGANPETVALNHLGSKQWEKAKRKAVEKINDVAAELLEIYAQRATKTGFAYMKPDNQYQAFASTFPFETTIDQQTTIDQVIQDMASPKSMDRLVCGDVGFGKTEVAMRAAFIAVQSGKQIAILVPTTLLAQQHYDNFQDRFADWPINIAMLSRFNTPQQQKTIIAKLKQGQIDIVIGTHKLLQGDIAFKDLGLLIVDEEHRFGVRQKEKIKSLRANIDILTLTATPIPRTLSMSLAAIRDLSIIATPPEKRLSIKTFVQETNNTLIREAILRETWRGGQVYFIHNDISSIDRIANDIEHLIPEAKIKIAHGQMRERQLEQIMSDFYHLRFNVLVCTTIIESGIDVPSANTIIIDRADRFGLAQLHQLRGRVGRSHHQAYAYLLVNSKKALTRDAKKRLDAISSMEDLGAGFTLATHDLEIRGAGEILGEDQSGQIQAIGYNLYMDFLDSAVKALKSGKQPELTKTPTIEIDLHIPALIPDTYVYDVHTRLTLYKRIANADNATLRELQVELIDRFGLLPQPTKNLFTIAELKLQAKTLGIRKITAGKTHGRIEFNEKPNIEPKTIIDLIQKHPDIYKLEGPQKLKFTIDTQDYEQRIQLVKKLIDYLA